MNRREFFKLLLLLSSSGYLSACIDTEEERKPSEIFFPQGVASGDPKENGVVLWTRVNPEVFDGSYISLEISRDSKFSDIIYTDKLRVNEDANFTVKAYVESYSLKPWSNYYYRFRYKDVYSKVGRFKTLSSDKQKINRIRIGIINCQDLSTGYYNVHYHILKENLDFVLFLGDYIYEHEKEKNAKITIRKLTLPSGNKVASTEDDYYYIYNTYKSELFLKELHRNYTFLIMWDDHEYANDCYGFHAPDHFIKDEEELKYLRISANKAWFYNLPVNVPFSEDRYDGIKTYRSFRFGNLLEIIMTDERLYRSPHPCGEGLIGKRYLTEGCEIEKAPYRTMLGEEQRNWFFDKLENSDTQWVFWGNPVLFVPLKFENYYVSFDSWDGFQYERNLILEKIKMEKQKKNLRNFVTLTGDIHSFVVGYAKLEDENIFPEFATTSATSSNIDEILPLDIDIGLIESTIKKSNKHLKYFNSHSNGYTIVDVYPEFIEITLKSVSTVLEKKSRVKIEKMYRINNGENKIIEI